MLILILTCNTDVDTDIDTDVDTDINIRIDIRCHYQYRHQCLGDIDKHTHLYETHRTRFGHIGAKKYSTESKNIILF